MNYLSKITNGLFLKTKTLKYLSVPMLVILPVCFTVMCLLSGGSALYFQLFSLKVSVVYYTLFMFLSFEYVYKLKAEQLYEYIAATPRGLRAVVKYKLLLLCKTAFVEFAVLAVVCCVFSAAEGTLTYKYFVYIVLSYFLNIFLLSVSGVFLGAVAALRLERMGAYLMMIFFPVMTSRILNVLWEGFYKSTGFNIFKITDLFSLSAPSTNWAPNTAFGYSFLPYRFATVLFWVFICAAFIASAVEVSKKKGKVVVCAFLAVLCFITYIAPSSKVIMDERNAKGPGADYNYYKSFEETELDNGGFNIVDLKLNITLFSELTAKAEIKVDNKKLSVYKFTLYHGYSVKEVKINGEKAEFERFSDYLEILNTSSAGADIITINYSGHSSRYYGNVQGCILPGYFPYYPQSGYCEVYDVNYQSFLPNRYDNEVNFDVKVKSLNRVYSNLHGESGNCFSGKAKSLTLVSGLYKESVIGGVTVIYPYTDKSELSEEILKENIEKFKKSDVDDGKIKKIIIVPSLNQGNLESVYSDDNYIISKWIVDLQEDYPVTTIDKHKLELYYCMDAFKNNVEYYDFVKDNFEFTTLFEQGYEKYGETEFFEKCNNYLFDGCDKRTIDDFLVDLVAKENNYVEN